MKHLLSVFALLIGLITASNAEAVEFWPTVAAVATAAIVSPTTSLLVNTVPNPLWIVGMMLVGPHDGASRYAMGGIVGGWAGAYASVGVYNLLKSKAH